MMPPVENDGRRLALICVLVAAVALAARAPGAVTYPLWQDEVASARILVEPSLSDAVGRVGDTESTPPAWYTAGWLLHRAGVPVESVRWLSVLCGAGAAVLTLLFARRFLGLAAATGAGLGVALAWQLVARGHELRAYSLYLLLAAALALVVARAADRPRLGRLAAVAMVTALGLLTHYFFALPVVTAAAWAASRGRRVVVRVGAALGAGILPLLAWIPGFAEQVGNGRYDWVAGFAPLKATAVYSTFVWNAEELYVEAQHVTIPWPDALGRVAILAAVVAGAVVLWRLGPEASLAALLATVPAALTAILWASGGSVFTTRNLVCAAPFAAMAVAALAAAFPRPVAVVAAATAVVLLGVGLVQERTLRPPPYDAFAERLRQEGWRPSDYVYIVGGAHRLSYLGSSYALRSPIGWYLPGHPFLALVDPAPRCDQAFVVDGSARPLAIEQQRCADIPPGGYWFRAGRPAPG